MKSFLTNSERKFNSSMDYMTNSTSTGKAGCAFECDLRQLLNNSFSRVRPQGVADINKLGRGRTLECKTGCGWIIDPAYSKEEMQSLIEAEHLPHDAKKLYIAYLPKYEMDANGNSNAGDCLIFKTKEFIKLLFEFKLLRVKSKKVNDETLWGIAIQSYIPTPTFKASQKRYDAFMEAMQENGMYYDVFAESIGLEI